MEGSGREGSDKIGGEHCSTAPTCKERLVYVSTDSADSACKNMSSQTMA